MNNFGYRPYGNKLIIEALLHDKSNGVLVASGQEMLETTVNVVAVGDEVRGIEVGDRILLMNASKEIVPQHRQLLYRIKKENEPDILYLQITAGSVMGIISKNSDFEKRLEDNLEK